MATAWTPSDLLDAIPINSTLVANAGTDILSKDDAVLTLLGRFGVTGDKLNSLDFSVVPDERRYAMDGKAEKLLGIIDTIVEALPEELRTSAVLSNVDLRPWLRELAGKPIEYRRVLDWAPDSRRTDEDGSQYTADDAEAFSALFSQQAQSRLAEYGQTTETDVTGAVRSVTDYNDAEAGVVATPDMVAGQPGNQFLDIANANFDSQGMSEEELRIAFTQSMDTDIFGLAGMVGEADNTLGMIEVGQSPFASLPSTQAPANPAAYRIPGAASRSAFYNWRALGDYLIKGQVTPTEIRTLQRKMVAAGLFDQMPDGFEPGDAVDRNTNMAWRALLAEAYRRKMSIHATMNQLAAERRRNIPSLQDPMAKSAMNYVVQNIIGRNLTDDEMTELRTYLIGIRDREGMAAAGIQREVGFTEAGVTQFVQTELGQEVQDVQRAGALDNYKAAMEAL